MGFTPYCILDTAKRESLPFTAPWESARAKLLDMAAMLLFTTTWLFTAVVGSAMLPT